MLQLTKQHHHCDKKPGLLVPILISFACSHTRCEGNLTIQESNIIHFFSLRDCILFFRESDYLKNIYIYNWETLFSLPPSFPPLLFLLSCFICLTFFLPLSLSFLHRYMHLEAEERAKDSRAQSGKLDLQLPITAQNLD